MRPAPSPPESALFAALRAAAATAAYALLHSTLASHGAKRAAARLVGERAARGWYRVAYNGHALAATAALGAYVWRHRGPVVWETRGAARGAVRVVQVVAIGTFLKALVDAGLGDLSGARPARDLLRGRPLRPVPDGQGPFEDDGGRPAPRGLSWRTRNPANVFIVPVLWAVPSARAGWVGMSAVFTAYAVAGSRHGERMLRARWGPAFAAYQASGVPFFMPAARGVGGVRAVDALPETTRERVA